MVINMLCAPKVIHPRLQLLYKAGRLSTWRYFPIAASIIISSDKSLVKNLRNQTAKLACKGRAAEQKGKHWRAFLDFHDAGLSASLVAALLEDHLSKARTHEYAADFYLHGLENVVKEKRPYDKIHVADIYTWVGNQYGLSAGSYASAGKIEKEKAMRKRSIASYVSGAAAETIIMTEGA